MDTGAAKEAWDPGGNFEWGDSFAITNFGIADDDVYTRMTAARDIISDSGIMSEAIFEEYSRSALKLHLHARKTCAMFS